MLPDFDPSGTGAQGTGGLQPEHWKMAGDQIGAGIAPENTPEAQRILAGEAEKLRRQLSGESELVGANEPGIEPGPKRPQPQAASVEVVPQVLQQPTEPTPPAQQSQEGSSDSRFTTERLQEIRQSFNGNWPAIAKSYDEQLQEIEGLKSGNQSEVALLTTEVRNLQTEIAGVKAAGFMKQPEQHPTQEGVQAEPPTAGMLEIDRDEFLDDPATHTARVMRHENRLVLEALNQRDEQREQKQSWNQKEREYQHHRPRMEAIFDRNPRRYQAMQEIERLNLLLEMAETEERADSGQHLYGMVKRGEVGGNPPSSTPVNIPYGSLPGPGGARLDDPRSPTSAPPEGWGHTKSMQALYRSGDGSVNEDQATMQVLKERGHFV